MRSLIAISLIGLMLASPAHGQAADPALDILVYGATGKIGSLTVAEALDRGHRVTAVSRDPAQIETRHANLIVARGDLLDADSIASLVAGKDIVIVAVRGIIGDSKTPESALQRIAAENIVEAIRDAGRSEARLIHVGGAGSLEVEPGVLYADKLPKIFLPKRLELEIAGQVLTLEYLRGISDVQWTYATPPRNFTNGKRTGDFRLGADRLLEDDRGRSRISRADFAVALIDEAERGDYIKERFSVAY